jgi:hypothetical protein
VDNAGYDSTKPISAFLLPGVHTLQANAGPTLTFTVNGDGTLAYDPALAGVLAGAGSSTLTVNTVATTRVTVYLGKYAS